MRKVAIAFGILFLGVGIAFLEYTIFPNRVQPFQNTQTAKVLEENVEKENSDALNIPISQVSEKNFEIAGIKNITRKNAQVVSHLFGQIILNKTADHMVVLKSDFFEGESPVVLTSIFEVFPKYTTTLSKAFAYIREKLDKKFKNDVESGANQTNEFGMYSLYFNSRKNPEKAFLLAVTQDRILGFEYLKTNHSKLSPLFNHLIPPMQ